MINSRKVFSRATLLAIGNVIFIFLATVAVIASWEQLGVIFYGSQVARLLFLVAILGLLAFLKFRKSIFRFIQKNKRAIFIIVAILTVVWQLLMIAALSGRHEWDPSIIGFVAAHKSIANWYPNYFSYYPNNYVLLVFERLIYNCLTLVGATNYVYLVVVLGIISYALVDISILLVYFIGKRWSKREAVGLGSAGILWLLVGITPFAAIPYSDVPALFINTALLVIIICFPSSFRGRKAFLAFVGGFLLVLGYYLKPPVIILAIAYCLVKLLMVRRFWITKRIGYYTLLFVCGMGLCWTPIHLMQEHNVVIHVDKSRAFPMNHFMAMGMTQDGGYNQKDVDVNKQIKDPQKRSSKNWQLIQERLQEKGVAGYLRFLYQKQHRNTADGTFAWGTDAAAGFLIVPTEGVPNWLVKVPRRIFLTFNQDLQRLTASPTWNGWAMLVQLVWVVTLFGLVGSFLAFDQTSFLLKLVIVGGMVFLLLFEGGRSRYLVQFMPFFVLLAGSGLVNMSDWLSTHRNQIKKAVQKLYPQDS